MHSWTKANKPKAQLIALLLSVLCSQTVLAAPEETPSIFENTAKLPVHQWVDKSIQARGIVVCIHGLTSSGSSYDTLARRLAAAGFIVFAPDLRGFGRWYHGDSGAEVNPKIDYNRSLQDLQALLGAAHAQYPHLPIMCLGESIGAAIAVRTAVEHAQYIDGLVLASAPVKPRNLITARSTFHGIRGLLMPAKQFDVTYYIQRYTSPDEAIVSHRLEDSWGRNKLSALDVVRANHFRKQSMKFAEQLNSEIPILLLQGGADNLMQARAYNNWFLSLATSDKSLHRFPEMGHVLLETPMVSSEVGTTIIDWLSQHTTNQLAQHPQRKVSAKVVPIKQ